MIDVTVGDAFTHLRVNEARLRGQALRDSDGWFPGFEGAIRVVRPLGQRAVIDGHVRATGPGELERHIGGRNPAAAISDDRGFAVEHLGGITGGAGREARITGRAERRPPSSRSTSPEEQTVRASGDDRG